MKILITGGDGQLALALARALRSAHELTLVSRRELDITDAAACQRWIGHVRPDVVLNAAAYTAVDRAESEVDLAFAVNCDGPGHLARACAGVDALLVHFSTDYVFDGHPSQRRAYREDDATAPLGVYGASKLAGEQAVASLCPAHLIFRLSWVYSNDGANFYKTMLRLAGERNELRVVADQWGVPNYAADLAATIARIATLPLDELRARRGVYHLSATAENPDHGVSWHAFATAIVAGAGLGNRVAVTPINTSDYPTAARRPAFSVLDGERARKTFGLNLPDWRDALIRCLAARASTR
ncbi:MAG: dTDP-4-dehydrorhamnose reductase [Burkholderiales bacterium]|nr:dTDP-4-dehydrorhamnose reductase [Burkholderiales bacterium]